MTAVKSMNTSKVLFVRNVGNREARFVLQINKYDGEFFVLKSIFFIFCFRLQTVCCRAGKWSFSRW